MEMFQSGDVGDSMAVWRLQSRLMMQITEIKCLSSGVGESSRGPWSPTKPHTFPRYAPKRVTTALHVKVNRPKEAARVCSSLGSIIHLASFPSAKGHCSEARPVISLSLLYTLQQPDP